MIHSSLLRLFTCISTVIVPVIVTVFVTIISLAEPTLSGISRLYFCPLMYDVR